MTRDNISRLILGAFALLAVTVGILALLAIIGMRSRMTEAVLGVAALGSGITLLRVARARPPIGAPTVYS